MKIIDMPKNERPREKALLYGIESLSVVELLAILIGSGTKDQSAIDIAYDIFQREKTILKLMTLSPRELSDVKGLNCAKAIKIAAAFELGKRYQISSLESSNAVIDSEYIYRLMAPHFLGLEKEKFAIVVLDRKRQIIRKEISDICTEDFINVGPKDVLSTCLQNKGKYFYLIHNHPNDELEPSIEDIRLTKILKTECPKFGVKMLDHLIIASQGYRSIGVLRDENKGK